MKLNLNPCEVNTGTSRAKSMIAMIAIILDFVLVTKLSNNVFVTQLRSWRLDIERRAAKVTSAQAYQISIHTWVDLRLTPLKATKSNFQPTSNSV